MMTGNNLFKNIDLKKISASASSAGSSSGVTVIDMIGYEGCMVHADLGTVATTVVNMYMTGGATTDALVELQGSTVYCTGTSGQMVVDIYRPLERYLSPVWSISTGDYLKGVYAFLYGPRVAPVSPSTSYFLSALSYDTLVSPSTEA